MAASLFEDFQVLALREVLLDTPGFQEREVCRWYAKAYGLTPLQVRELPFAHILQEFYESMYRDMSPEEREQERQELLIDPEERQRRQREQDHEKQAKAEFEEMTKKMIAEQKAREEVDRKKITNVKSEPLPRVLPETQMPEVASHKDPENIEMVFANTPEEFERLLDEDAGPELASKLMSKG